MSLLGSISYYAIERIEQLTDDEVADAISTNSILNSAIRINFVDVDFRGNRRHYVAFKGFLHQNPVKLDGWLTVSKTIFGSAEVAATLEAVMHDAFENRFLHFFEGAYGISAELLHVVSLESNNGQS